MNEKLLHKLQFFDEKIYKMNIKAENLRPNKKKSICLMLLHGN